MTKTSNYISSTSKEYSIYVCENRAIPKIQDGLKDSQRKALWVLKNRREKIKTISLAGEMISQNLYLHGDTAASDAISQMAAPFNNNTTLIEGIGTFGTRIEPIEGISAPRYTYVKSSKITEHLVYPDSDIIPLKDNYDGSTKEPVHFLPLIPLILLNGISGIAVGWATKIYPRSLQTIVNACQAVLKGKTLPSLTPEFTYLNVDVVNSPIPNVFNAYGKVELGKAMITITELPPGMSLIAFRKKLNAMEEEGLIQSYKDNSAKNIKFIVKFKRGVIDSWTEADAISFFELSSRLTENIVAVDWDNSSIRKFESPEQIVMEFVKWRLDMYKQRFLEQFRQDDYECSYWLGVKYCFDKKIANKVQKSKSKEEVIQLITNATNGVDLDSDQLSKIASLPLYKWAEDEYTKVLSKIDELIAKMEESRSYLADDKKMSLLYSQELNNLVKYCK